MIMVTLKDLVISPSVELGHGFLLSVCIPTYNRAAYLDQCLSALVPQASALGVPIFISDNASNDDTPAVIQKYQACYQGLKAIRQDTNVGYDLNHKAVIGMATSEFAWLLGDDDVVFEGALGKVVSALIADPDCDLMLLNAKLTDNDLQPRGRQFNIDRDVNLTACNELLKSYSDKLTFGMMIIRARLFNQTEADRFIGTAHLYAGGTYEYLAENYLRNGCNRIHILKEPFVYLRQGERQWTIAAGDVSVRQIPEFYFRLHPCYCSNARAGLMRAVGSYRMLLPLVRLRAEGWLDSKRAADLKKYYVGRYRFRLIVFSKMPIFMAQGIAVIGVFSARALKVIKRIYFTLMNMTKVG